MSSYEKDLEKNTKRNEKFIKEFEEWLKDKNLTPKTINKHLDNIDLYINDYLNYHEITKMENGTTMAYMFLDDWFIRKCLYSSKTSLMENATSIKKFYQCMSEMNYVSVEDYKFLCQEISENMDNFLNSLEEYDNMCDEDFEDYF